MLNKKHPQPNTLSQWRTGRGHRLYFSAVLMLTLCAALACLIFSAFMSSGSPVLDTNLTPVVMAWQYIAETIFNMLVLVGLVKGAERIVRELFGL